MSGLAGSAGGERQVSDGEYTSPAGSAAQLLIRNTAPAAKQIDLVVRIHTQSPRFALTKAFVLIHSICRGAELRRSKPGLFASSGQKHLQDMQAFLNTHRSRPKCKSMSRCAKILHSLFTPMCSVQVELQPQQQMSTVHSPVGGETVTSPVGGETVTTYRRSLLEAPARSGIDSVGISDKQRTTSERPLGGRRSLLADSDTQDTLDKIKGTKIKFSSFIEDITNKVPKKHRKTVKIVIIVAIVLACLVALCCLWCLIKIVLCPCCCAAKMLK